MSNSKEDAMKFIEENDVRFLRLQFVDLFGRMKNVAITSGRLLKAIDGGVLFDASSIEGFSGVEASDMFLVPDLDTLSSCERRWNVRRPWA
jgi:glutamine synthetase